ncbi:MAG: ABC transporter permease [Cyclobacteriaceae bacterium]
MGLFTDPPKLGHKVLKIFLKKDYLEEIEGDLEEVYHDNIELLGLKKAKRIYAWDVIKLIRPKLLKNLNWINKLDSIMMITNNIKIALRVFKRDKAYTFINLLGLSTGLAIALLIIQYVRFETSYEDYNTNADRVARITMDYLNGETVVDQDCETYAPLSPLIVDRINEAVGYTRAYNTGAETLQVGEKIFREMRIFGADSSFFDIMGYPLIQGDQRTIFRNPFEIVLTESMVYKYFDKPDVVGESIRFQGRQESASFKVVGVVEDSPPNTHLKFDFLISYASMEKAYNADNNSWSGNNTFAYILLQKPSDLATFQQRLIELNLELKKEERLEDENVIAQLISDIHLYSDKSFEPEKNGDAQSVFFLFCVALLVILIALVNYINLSTSKSLDRAKEVGIRKVMGSSLLALRTQFFTESFLINFFAVGLAIIFMIIGLDSFKNIASLPSSFTFIGDPQFWMLLGLVFFVSVFFAGIFPAFVLSGFSPIAVLKGKFGNSSAGSFMRKSLVVFQFAITGFLLVQTLTASEQIRYMRSLDNGFDKEQSIVLRTPSTAKKEEVKTFQNQLKQFPEIVNVSNTSCVPGLPSKEMSTTTGIKLSDATEDYYFNFYIYFMDEDFIPTLGLEVLAGNNFLPNSLNEKQVIVNEESIALWGIPTPEEAVGKTLDFWGERFTIKGVVKNFNQASAKSPHIAMVMLYNDGWGDYLVVKTDGGDVSENVRLVQEKFEAFYTNSPFNYFFLDERFDQNFRSEEQFKQVFGLLTGFAILIACLGLYGLSSFTIAKRVKEIGVRKVLGASVIQLIMLLSKDFMKLVGLSLIIALPVSYLIIDGWLDNYAVKIDISWWLFALPSVMMLLLSFLTVYVKTYRVAQSNPSGSLRDE